MATYNGGKYIENQLLSLLAQTHKDWTLYVHDDGSIDDTIDILERYRCIDSRIVIIQDRLKFGNAGQNFLHLLQFATADYIIFCDQDDIWFESKLQVLYGRIKGIKTPYAVYCNAHGYDGCKITTQQVSLIQRDKLENSLFLNSGVQGSSLMFNRALVSRITPYPDYVYMHDHFVTMAAVTFGELCYVDQSLMLYRQHQDNVTGNVPINIYSRIKTFLNRSNPILEKRHYKANASFYQRFKNDFTDRQREVFQAYLKFISVSLPTRISYILRYGFSIGSSKVILLIKVIYKQII
ncbi:glycosyltransferase [Sphingobacterium spiritivorum]